MPMIDLTLAQGALTPAARAEAVERLTEALLRHEGAPDSRYTRAMTWVFVHELPAQALNVAGAPAELPLYRVEVTVPAGTMLHGPGPFAVAARRNLVSEVTEILLSAEGAHREEDAGRVYCVIREVADGHWGALGSTITMEEIATVASPESETPLARRAREAIDSFAPSEPPVPAA